VRKKVILQNKAILSCYENIFWIKITWDGAIFKACSWTNYITVCDDVVFCFFYLFIYVGCPGQLTRTTTIPHGSLDILQAQEQVRHRGGDRRAHKGSNPGRERNKSHDCSAYIWIITVNSWCFSIYLLKRVKKISLISFIFLFFIFILFFYIYRSLISFIIYIEVFLCFGPFLMKRKKNFYFLFYFLFLFYFFIYIEVFLCFGPFLIKRKKKNFYFWKCHFVAVTVWNSN
jgi:hypothetical protein